MWCVPWLCCGVCVWDAAVVCDVAVLWRGVYVRRCSGVGRGCVVAYVCVTWLWCGT